jgi:hypothetical protein
MRIQSFIFCHDQNLILEFISNGKFNHLPNLKFVFLGTELPVDQIENLENVVICRNLPINIEIYPKFTSFTGWYALWKNNLIDADYINLFEYDVDLSEHFLQTLNSTLENKPDFIGYRPLQVSMYFIDNVTWIGENIIPAINKHYNIDVHELVEDWRINGDGHWSSGSNSTFFVGSFYEYMSWFDILIDEIKHTWNSGHAFERSISFFNFIKVKKILYLPGILHHYQKESHHRHMTWPTN